MQLNHKNFTSQSQGALETAAFGVNFDSVMAYSFMSGIAKDKIGYPVREIGTNAYDANPDAPFDVKLPTLFDPIFCVRDYGPGLSHDEIFSVYTTFGGSLKRDSNDQVGGLGLGSKSPFAYLISRNSDGAGSFTVRSFQNGEVRTYIMTMAPNGMPECRYFGATPTNDPTGIEVSFVVDKADILLFHEAVSEIYWHFPVQPNISPPLIAASDIVETGDNWTLYPSNSNIPIAMPHVRMGCVAYPININIVDPTFPFHSSPIVFDAPIGSLSFTTSREELGYDVPTKEQLSTLLSSFLKDYATKIQSQIDEAPTYIDACKIFRKLAFNHKAIDVLNQRSLISYKGRKLFSSFTGTKSRWNVMILNNINDAVLFKADGHTNNSRSSASTWEISFDALNFNSVVYSKASSNNIQRLQKLNPAFPVLWIRTREDTKIEDIIEKWDLSSLNPVNLNKVKIDRRNISAPALNVKSLPYLSASAEISREEHNLDLGGVYILKHTTTTYRRRNRNRINYHDGHSIKDSYLIRRMFDYAKLEPQRLWVFDADAPPDNTNGNWTLLSDVVHDLLDPLVDLKAVKVRQENNELPYEYEKFNNINKYLSIKPDTNGVGQDFVDFCARVSAISDSKSTAPDENMRRYLDWFPAPAGELSLKTDLENEFNQLCAKYPLLRIITNSISRWDTSGSNVEPLNHYFTLLNHQK